jgi:large subunit ribosomal protein L25
MAQAVRTELNAARREVLGKKVRQLRRQGLTPANIFGRRLDSLAVQVSSDELRRVLHSAGRNAIVYLRLDGDEPRPTFVKDVQRNPVSDVVLHVDFLQISLKETVKLDVQLHLVGLAPAVDKLGGILVHGLDHVMVEALPTEVPSVIEVDVSGLVEIDQALHVSDLRVPEGVTVLTDPEQVVAKVSPPAVMREEEEEKAAAEAAAAEAAAAEEAGAAAAEEGSTEAKE